MRQEPSAVQWRVLGFVRAWYVEHDRLPTMQQIADAHGWKSANAAQAHVDYLVAKGWLEKGVSGYRFSRSTSPSDLVDEALELEIVAAGKRLQAAHTRLTQHGCCYFAGDGDMARLAALQADLIGRRSAEQVRRMECEGRSA